MNGLPPASSKPRNPDENQDASWFRCHSPKTSSSPRFALRKRPEDQLLNLVFDPLDPSETSFSWFSRPPSLRPPAPSLVPHRSPVRAHAPCAAFRASPRDRCASRRVSPSHMFAPAAALHGDRPGLKIPNNVDLASNKADLQRRSRTLAARSTSTGGGRWGRRVGPKRDVYLRTAVSVDAKGWAHFDYREDARYRWGIFLTPLPIEAASSASASTACIRRGTRCPARYRSTLPHHRLTQGDTRPASVEQQRMLGHVPRSPRPPHQPHRVNVGKGPGTSGRWCLLHAYFPSGRRARGGLEGLLERRSATPLKPASSGQLQQEDHQLAVVLLLHLPHGS